MVGRIEDLVGLRDADGHRVDQDVAVIGGVEIDLAADRRHADAIAVAADARDHSGDQVPRLGMVGPAEAQRIQVRDGPGAHGEDVAQNPADPGRRALIRLDIGRVVVALHLEDRGVAVADVDHPGILARALDHPRRGRRQLLQMDPARFVRAMLRPHDREDAELDQVRLAPERLYDALIFFVGQAVFGDHGGGDLGGFEDVHGRRLSVVGEASLGRDRRPWSDSGYSSRKAAPGALNRSACNDQTNP
jgi:hypothetical protein